MFKKIYKSMRLISLLALVVSVVLVFSVCYYIFNNHIESEIKAQAEIVADFIDYCGIDSVKENMPESFKECDFAVISESDKLVLINNTNGTLPDDNSNKLHQLNAVKRAYNNGYAESEKYSTGFFGKIYIFAKKLNDGNVLIVSRGTLDIFTMMTELVLVIVFIAVLIFVVTALISKRLTENIVAPIENTSLNEIDDELSPYDELKPFIVRIAYQSKEIKRQIERVERQKLRLQTVSDSMNEGLVVLDKNGDVLSINKSAARCFGIDEELLVLNKNIYRLVGENTLFADHMTEAYSDNERGSFYHTHGENTYEVFYSPVSRNAGVMGIVILMFDITEKLKNERIRTEFTANVSHELKTPLTSIHGYAQLINSGMAKNDDIKLFSEKIEKESSRLITLVEDIIELSNLDEGIECEKTNFSIYKMLEEICDSLKLNAGRRNIVLSLSGEDFYIIANREHIRELLFNIVDNAIKYNKDDGKVDVKVAENRMISVSDTGIGIPDEFKDRIFERFFRVDKSHSKTVNGTGLGLSIVKHIAMNNKIGISVESKQGEGTEFKIDFSLV